MNEIFEGVCGQHIRQYCEEAVAKARLTCSTVHCRFNNAEFDCLPSDSVASAEAKWHRQFEENGREGAKRRQNGTERRAD